MTRIVNTCLIAFLLCATAMAADRPRITGDEGATFEDLIREQRLVTITLRTGAQAQDHNMKVTGINDTRGTLAVIDGSGAPTAYKFESIRDVHVQKDKVLRDKRPNPDSVLSAEDKAIVADAANRARAIYLESKVTPLKMNAAGLLAASNHENKADALSYLHELSNSNDAATSMLAAHLLWLNGETISDEILLTGFNSGNRTAKALAADLAGLTKASQFVVELRKLLGDPSKEISPYAAVALGEIADEDSIPKLVESLSSITDEKAEAAVYALSIFQSPEATRRLEEALETAEKLVRFRIVRALYAQGNERARTLLSTEYLKEPAFDKQAALILAEDGDPDALKFLRDFLAKPYDPNEDNLIFRAEAGMALYVAGDIQAKGIVADVLNTRPNDIYAAGRTADQKFKEETVRKVQVAVCRLMGTTMRRDMLPVLAGPIQNSDPTVALAACRAAMQIGNQDFGKRLRKALSGF